LLPLACGAGAIIVDEDIRLTDGKGYNHPSWSPDGKKLTYAYNQGIWVMNADGSGTKKLYDTLAWSGDPVFNHDGSKIYYATESRTAYSARYISLHVMNADGSNNVKLTGTSDSREPSVSPDGRSISYVSKISGNYDIWIMDISSRKSVQITDDKGDEASPSWSPDGTRLLYSLGGDIYTQETDAVKATRLTDDEFNNIEPAYSPQGDMIVFSSDRDGSYDLWIMRTDGTGMKKLTMERSSERAPAWSPEGSRIAYISNAGGEYNLWVLKLRVEKSEQAATVEYLEEESVPEISPHINRVRAFATEEPKKFIISILLISFVIVSGIVYSFLRKIR
jgi:TolB protein